MNWFALLPLILQYGPQIATEIEALWAGATSNQDFVTKIENAIPGLAAVANEIARIFFPNQAPAVAKVAATALLYNKTLVLYAQKACNLVMNSGLVEDGLYGPKTAAAVKALQAHLGLNADGIFGKITESAVKKLGLPGL